MPDPVDRSHRASHQADLVTAAIWGVVVAVSAIQTERLLGGGALQVLLTGLGVSLAWTFADRIITALGFVLEAHAEGLRPDLRRIRREGLRTALVQFGASLPVVAPFSFLALRPAGIASAGIAVLELAMIGLAAGRVARSRRVWLWVLVLPFVVGAVQVVLLVLEG